MSKLTIEVDEATARAVRDAVVAVASVNYGYTLRRFAADAFRAELERLQAEHNAGKPFPHRDVPLRKGPTVREP